MTSPHKITKPHNHTNHSRRRRPHPQPPRPTPSCRTHRHLRHLEDADIVGHGAHHDDDAVLALRLVHEADDACQRHGRPVDLAHEQPLQDDAVELCSGTAGQEPVQLWHEVRMHEVRMLCEWESSFLHGQKWERHMGMTMSHDFNNACLG